MVKLVIDNLLRRKIMEERRGLFRKRTLLRGKIAFFGRSTFECVIRNLSETGAKLCCDQHIALPDNFELVIEKTNERVSARAVWRNATEIGVAFRRQEAFGNVVAFSPRNLER
jgi:hypothetical protein